MKIPKQWAGLLAQLHNKVMELQDTFDTIKQDLYMEDFEDDEIKELNLNDYDLNELTSEIESICDKLEDLEADTSALDCEYNDYGY